MERKIGEENLVTIIRNMEPVLHNGEYVFATVTSIEAIPRELPIFEFKEQEGVTIVVSKHDANTLQLPIDFIAAWITLNIHSSLAAIGLTAAFATKLSDYNISCNVVAGYYHDHIFVDYKDKEKAMEALWELTKKDINS